MPRIEGASERTNKGVCEWLNREYVEKALREKHCDESIEVLSMQIVPAVSKGDNYLCTLYRVQLEYKTSQNGDVQNVSLIAKMKLEDSSQSPVDTATEEHDVNSHEMIMYGSLLPKMSSLLEKSGFTGQLAPAAVQVDPERKCLLLEDLCHSKYIMADKKVGLDLIHAKLALRKVAEFHAAGAKLNEIESGFLETFTENVFKCDAFEPFFRGQLESCGQAVKTWKGYERYGEKLLQLAPRIMQGGQKMFSLQDGHFHTFIHSDFWINNIMYKYDTRNNPTDCVLIDFQFNVWASPAIDITYFVNVSVSDDIRWDCEEELVRYYSTCLADNLRALAYKGKIPTFEEFWSQYHDKGFNELTSTCVVLPLILNESQGDEAKDIKHTPYHQPRVEKALKRLLPEFEQLGFLNYV